MGLKGDKATQAGVPGAPGLAVPVPPPPPSPLLPEQSCTIRPCPQRVRSRSGRLGRPPWTTPGRGTHRGVLGAPGTHPSGCFTSSVPTSVLVRPRCPQPRGCQALPRPLPRPREQFGVLLHPHRLCPALGSRNPWGLGRGGRIVGSPGAAAGSERGAGWEPGSGDEHQGEGRRERDFSPLNCS